jgi:hypothetical protein
MKLLIKTFLLTIFSSVLIILPVQAQDSLGTCTCSERGEATSVDSGMIGGNFYTPTGYDWEPLTEAMVFDTESNDCANGIHIISNYVRYRDCNFVLTNPTIKTLADEFKISEPILGLTWPGLNFTKAEQAIYTDVYGQRYLQMPWLAEFIKNLYTYTLGIISIVAVVMIIIEGIKIILGGAGALVGGENNTTSARLKNITRVMIGLFIAWGSYLILYQINPDLVKFQILQVAYVEEIDMPADYSTPTDVGEIGNVFPNNWVPFASLSNLNGQENRMARKDLVDAFTTAVVKYGGVVILGDAGRSPQQQYNIMKTKCACPSENKLPMDVNKSDWYKYCSKITLENGRLTQAGDCAVVGLYINRKDGVFQGPLAGHVAGNAVDANVPPKSNLPCSQLDEKERLSDGILNTGSISKGQCIPKAQQEFIGVMLDSGFCVGLNAKSNLREAWHFEYMGNELRLSGFCANKETLKKQWGEKLYYLK